MPDGMIALLREHGGVRIERSRIGIPFAIDSELYTINSTR